MGYLLTKQADVTLDKTPLGIPYVKPADSETAGNMLGGLVTGGGLAGTTAIGNALFKKKMITDKAYKRAVNSDMAKVVRSLRGSDSRFAKWLSDHMFKQNASGTFGRKPSLLGKGVMLTSGFKKLRLPGKLKALGLIAAPFAAGGLIDAAVD